ncbi:NlpC/P60 family protein [Streptomyces sp. NPDC001941]|uniref:C40 family peptidase n=1 Tax=Streptomyces sp. NPDC001941 TaxID=3154659 RepID=UPI0033166CF6
MAAHRKPRQRPLTGPAARTAATLALAGAATATAFEGSGYAEPRLTPAQVKAKVDRLYQEAEEATEAYNGAREKADEARASYDALRGETARKERELGTARAALGSIAAAQYRSGGLDPALQIALTADPEHYLEEAALADRVGERQAQQISAVRGRLVEIGQLRSESDQRLSDLKARQDELSRHKATIQGKLSDARALLDRLTAEQRASYEAQGTGDGQAHADRSMERGALRAPNSRAAEAVAYAYGALGKPYVWGATGPGSYDCSGLTQAAWSAAGVSLPRTTYTQINAGQRISRSQLAPGDLVFFYSGISHVGLYIGNGQMIHAPHPGAPVRIAPIDQMPFAGATRVA